MTLLLKLGRTDKPSIKLYKVKIIYIHKYVNEPMTPDLGTAAGHSAAEEDVDEQHDGEEDPERDAQVGQPRRVNRA